jgi:hypothetical protein
MLNFWECFGPNFLIFCHEISHEQRAFRIPKRLIIFHNLLFLGGWKPACMCKKMTALKYLVSTLHPKIAYLRVIVFFAFFKTGFPSSIPAKICASLSSGNKPETSSSNPMRPRSMHCIAATEVASLVHDATQKVVASDTGVASGFRLVFPIQLIYLNVPGELLAIFLRKPLIGIHGWIEEFCLEDHKLNVPSMFAAASITPGRLFFPVSSRSSRSRLSMLAAMRCSEKKLEGLKAESWWLY